jgi:hypothetical protein
MQATQAPLQGAWTATEPQEGRHQDKERDLPWEERERANTLKGVREEKGHQRRDEEYTTDADPSTSDTDTQSCRTTVSLVEQFIVLHGSCRA